MKQAAERLNIVPNVVYTTKGRGLPRNRLTTRERPPRLKIEPIERHVAQPMSRWVMVIEGQGPSFSLLIPNKESDSPFIFLASFFSQRVDADS